MALREWFVYVVESPAFFDILDIIVRMVLMPMGTLENHGLSSSDGTFVNGRR